MSQENKDTVLASFQVFKHFIDSTREEPYLEQQAVQIDNLGSNNKQFSFNPTQHMNQVVGNYSQPGGVGQPSMAEFLMQHGDFQNPAQEIKQKHQILEAMNSVNNHNLDQNIAYMLQSVNQSQPAALLLNQLISGDPNAIALLKQNTGIEDDEQLQQFVVQALVPQLLMNSTK